MICNNNNLADILRVCEIKDLIWVMRFQSPLVYIEMLCCHSVCTSVIGTSIVAVAVFISEKKLVLARGLYSI